MEDALLIIADYYDTTYDNILALLNKNFKLKKSLIDKDIKSGAMKNS